MRIEELDQNLKVETTVTEPDLLWLDAKTAPFALSGVFYDPAQGCYVRFPQSVADRVSPGVAHLNHNTAGGRVRFCTDSSFIGIRAVMDTKSLMPHITLAGQSGFDLYQKTVQGDVYLQTFMPPMGMREGYSSSAKTDGKLRQYTINFPLYDGVKELYIALKKGSLLEAPAPYAHPRPVVFYGSSITQGGCASRPGNAYEAMISRTYDTEYINLGFSGQCKAETVMAEYLASLDMSVFVCDYDHNTPNPEHLAATHLPLYRTVRAAQPDLPIVFVSAPDVLLRGGVYETRRQIVEKTYQTALAEGDTRVRFVDGRTLFAGPCWDSCTVDGCHPNDLGFFRMAQAIGAAVGKFFDK